MGMELRNVIEYLQAAGVLTAIIVGWNALRTFEHTVRLKRAEWLDKLHSKFYESENYKRIRRILDYQLEPDYEQLERAVSRKKIDEESCVLAENFVDFLNFFEYIAALRRTGQLSDEEIFMLFEYYLRLLNRRPFVVEYVKKYGFENLSQLLSKLPLDPARGST